MYNRIKQLTLVVGDFAMLVAGYFGALALRYIDIPTRQGNGLTTHMLPLFGLALVLLFIAGLYDIGKIKNNTSLYKRLGVTAATWVILSVLFFYTSSITSITPKTILLLTAAIGFGLITLWRAIYHTFISRSFLSTNLIFVGLTEEALEIITVLKNQPEHGYQVVGCVVTNAGNVPAHVPHATTLNALLKKIPVGPDTIVVSPNMANNDVLTDLYHTLFRQVSIVNLADFYEGFFGRVPSFVFSEAWFVTNLHEQNKKVYDRFRILVDYAIAALMTLFFIVTFPFIALIIKISSRGPVLFKQVRVGRAEEPFTMYKYRTMKALTASGSAEVGGPQFAAKNDQRITAVGTFLRKTRLDELPQCINILRGEMGLIGPRPERPEFVAELTNQMPFYALRHLIKPGLTGWAQLQQSYYGTLSENLFKLQYDLFYVKNRSFFLDLAILLRTINILIRMMGR